MSIWETGPKDAVAVTVRISAGALTVDLDDGRVISVPLSWFPRLQTEGAALRSHWVLVEGGSGIRWPGLDLVVTVAALLAGRHAFVDSKGKWLLA